MKLARLTLFLFLGLITLGLSACGGAPPAATWPGLAADQEAAYLANGAAIYAVRLSDGKALWTFSSRSGSTFYANPAFTQDGQLLIGSAGNDYALFRLDPKASDDLRVTWTFNEARDYWLASPLVISNLVYAPNADGKLYIFDLSLPGDGAEKLLATVELGGKLWSQPVTDGERLYVAALNHQLHIVDLATYAVKTIDLGGALAGSPAIADGLLYLGSFASDIIAIRVADGSVAWTVPAKSRIWGGPLVNDGKLYLGDLDGNFYVIDVADGTVLTSFQANGAIIASPILVQNDILFVTEQGAIYSLRPGETTPVSLEKVDGRLYTTPVAVGDTVLVAPFRSESALLVALDRDGRVLWSFTPQ